MRALGILLVAFAAVAPAALAAAGGPVAKASPPLTVHSGDVAPFDGSGSTASPNSTIVSYAWSFGDGAKAIGVRVNHSFAHPGAYNVTLAVVDAKGQSASSVVHVTVLSNATKPAANATHLSGNATRPAGNATKPTSNATHPKGNVTTLPTNKSGAGHNPLANASRPVAPSPPKTPTNVSKTAAPTPTAAKPAAKTNGSSPVTVHQVPGGTFTLAVLGIALTVIAMKPRKR